MVFEGWFIVENSIDVYNGTDAILSAGAIESSAVTGDVAYKAYYTGLRYPITLPEEVEVFSGVEEDGGLWYVKKGTDVTFKLDDSAYIDGFVPVVTYKVNGGEETVLTPDASGVYTIPGGVITGNITVSLKYYVDGVISFIDNEDYKGALDGCKVMLLTLNGDPITNATYEYDGIAMFWSEKYDAYVLMVDETLTEQEAIAGITATVDAGGSKNIAIVYDGNIMVIGIGVNIIDAQAVYELYMGAHRTNYDVLDEMQRLKADMNGDKTIDLQDVDIIISIYYKLYI
jgi:hypothetical protein